MIKRRVFVQATVAGSAAAATGLLQIGCGPQVQPAPYVESALISGNRLRVAKDHLEFKTGTPEFIANHGGAITVLITGDRPANVPEAVLVVRRKDGLNGPLEWAAMNSACPHLGCPLGWGAAVPTGKKLVEGMVQCPCHQSRFALQDPSESDTGECITLDRAPALAPPALYPIDDTSEPNALLISFEVAAKTVQVPFALHPALQTTGGAAVVRTGGCEGIVVVRTGATTAEAYTATCTHLGCSVAYTGVELVCPCHNSRFDLKGRVLEGPAELPLKMFAATVQADHIAVTTG